ncbi:MAG: hypothetical protein [Circular genetic element sp.]|nr:MAG: hypothetical protein [Circular genetic element sp.]
MSVPNWVYGGVGGAALGVAWGDSWQETAIGFAAGTPAGQRGFAWLGRQILSKGAFVIRTPWVRTAARWGASRVAVPIWLAFEMVDLVEDFASGDPEVLHDNNWVMATDWAFNANPTSPYSGFNRFLDIFYDDSGVQNPFVTGTRY